jgi:DNA-binding CsgD family transcriptional regulator
MLAIPEIPPAQLEAFARLRHENPLVARYSETRDGRAYRFSDFVTQEQLRQLQVYREVYRPLRVEYQIAFTLPAAENRILGIALSREHPDYSDSERELLDRSRPFLIELYRNAIEYERLRNRLGVAPNDLQARLRRVGLSRRQAEVVALLATGLDTGQVAERLGLSVRTVSKHTQLAYRALRVHNLAEAVTLASRLLDSHEEVTA